MSLRLRQCIFRECIFREHTISRGWTTLRQGLARGWLEGPGWQEEAGGGSWESKVVFRLDETLVWNTEANPADPPDPADPADPPEVV